MDDRAELNEIAGRGFVERPDVGAGCAQESLPTRIVSIRILLLSLTLRGGVPG